MRRHPVWTVRLLLVTVTVLATGCKDGSSPANHVDTTMGEVADAGDIVPDISNDLADPQDLAPLPPLVIPEGCNPLAADWDCMLPYPSDFFLVDDATLPSGHRVELGEAATPRTADGKPLDPMALHPTDGFSHLPPIMALFPDGVDSDGLVFHDDDVSLTLGPGSHTVILEAASGQPVLHFAEIDPWIEVDSQRILFLRPMVRLDNETRYVVAIQGLTDPDGDPVPTPEGFRRIRDGQAGQDPELAALAQRYEEDVFPILESFGVQRADLQLAWDFTTQSMDQVAGDMFAVRADAISRFEAEPPPITVTSVEDDVDEYIHRRIEARMTVPLYMEHAGPGALLFRDTTGAVTTNGTVDVPFLVQIPHSVAEGRAEILPSRVVQFGHGFFGDTEEVDGSFVRRFADRLGVVIVATNWWGMSSEDSSVVSSALLNEPAEMVRFGDRVHQGMANFIALTYIVRGPLGDLVEMRQNGSPVFDPDQLYYYGISQGHILGGTYLALSPHHDRGVLGVGGAAFSFMMYRSFSFQAFLLMIESVVPDRYVQQKYAALAQTSFDRFDPITYAPHVLADTLTPGPEARRILMQIGIGDTSVPNLASHLHARALGLSHLQPAPRPIPGLPTVDAPTDGSAIIEWDYNLPSPLPGDLAVVPEAANEVHEAVRRTDASMAQIDAFFRPDGPIENPCDGACDPD